MAKTRKRLSIEERVARLHKYVPRSDDPAAWAAFNRAVANDLIEVRREGLAGHIRPHFRDGISKEGRRCFRRYPVLVMIRDAIQDIVRRVMTADTQERFNQSFFNLQAALVGTAQQHRGLRIVAQRILNTAIDEKHEQIEAVLIERLAECDRILRGAEDAMFGDVAKLEQKPSA
jgi:hypothetical protein